jgi:hypothetical protein
VLPSYFSRTPNDNGELSTGLLLLSDDDGLTWRAGAQWSFGLAFPNESQAAEVAPDVVYIHSRGLENARIQAWSYDGGQTVGVGNVSKVDGLVQPLEGCEGSTVLAEGALWYSGPSEASLVRYNMSVFAARDLTRPRFELVSTVDPGSSAYSAMVALPDDRGLGLLYERSNTFDIIFVPDAIVFTTQKMGRAC